MRFFWWFNSSLVALADGSNRRQTALICATTNISSNSDNFGAVPFGSREKNQQATCSWANNFLRASARPCFYESRFTRVLQFTSKCWFWTKQLNFLSLANALLCVSSHFKRESFLMRSLKFVVLAAELEINRTK